MTKSNLLFNLVIWLLIMNSAASYSVFGSYIQLITIIGVAVIGIAGIILPILARKYLL